MYLCLAHGHRLYIYEFYLYQFFSVPRWTFLHHGATSNLTVAIAHKRKKLLIKQKIMLLCRSKIAIAVVVAAFGILTAIGNGDALPMNATTRELQQAFLQSQLQPTVIEVEHHPARRHFGTWDLSSADGTVWCDGRPTYWLSGHQPKDETPWYVFCSV